MGETVYAGLPAIIRKQIDLMADASEDKDDPGLRERLAANWQDKFALFSSQIKLLGMEELERIERGDGRGLILLTYSGSLLSLGPEQDGERWIEYAAIKLRSDVPEIVSGEGAAFADPPERDRPLDFTQGPLKSTSAIYRIAACLPDVPLAEQDRRIREAAIFLTNGFMKLNRSVSREVGESAEQFTLKGMCQYLARKNDLPIVQMKQILEDFFATAETGLMLGERVSLGRLGHLSLKLQNARKARLGRNPQTGEEILIAARPEQAAPRISFSASLKEKLSGVDPALAGGSGGEEEEAEDGERS